MTLGFKHRPHWWEGSALITAPPLHLEFLVTHNCIFVKVINNVQNPWHEISDQNRKKLWFSPHLTSAIFNNNNNNIILVSMYCI